MTLALLGILTAYIAVSSSTTPAASTHGTTTQYHLPQNSLTGCRPRGRPNHLTACQRRRRSPAHPQPCRDAPPPTLEVSQRSKTLLSTVGAAVAPLVLCETTMTSGHTVTGATRERQRATTTRDDDNEVRRDTAGKVVLPPPSREVRGRWLDLAISHH